MNRNFDWQELHIFLQLIRINFSWCAYIECGFAIEDSQYYGLETLLLHNHTFFGYVVRDKDSDSRTFTKCTVQSPSQYWNSRKWAELFTTEEMMKVGGRRLDNFAFVKDGDGLAMTVRLFQIDLFEKDSLHNNHKNNFRARFCCYLL